MRSGHAASAVQRLTAGGGFPLVVQRRLQPQQLAVVHPPQQQLRRDGPAAREEHVPLRVPHVALRAEERAGRVAACERGPPLRELVDTR